MNEVLAIKDLKKLENMKKYLKGESIRNYLLLVMGINIGLRISDLLQFKVSDIMDSKGNIRTSRDIIEQKTGKTRVISYNKSVNEAIKEYLSSQTDTLSMDEYLFKSREGQNKPITRVSAYNIINQAAHAVGIKGKIGTHTLRKTFGYWAYKQGIDITMLQKVFGHSNPALTLRYIGITADDIRNVYLTLNL